MRTLNAYERFAFRQTLRANLNDAPARQAAAMMWMWRLIKVGETPWVLREQAMKKIAAFALTHKEMMEAAFGGD